MSPLLPLLLTVLSIWEKIHAQEKGNDYENRQETERYGGQMNIYPTIGYFETLLDESVKMHGHLCPGQVLGVRMALYGLDKIGIDEPKGKDRGSLYLLGEIDRCTADALESVTGCNLGHRTMRFTDYVKMAATFVNLSAAQAVRVVTKGEGKRKAQEYFPHMNDKYRCQIEAYKVMPDEELFYHETINVFTPPEDIPGNHRRRLICNSCGRDIQDKSTVYKDGKILCRLCAHREFYWTQEIFYIIHHYKRTGYT